MRCDKCPLYPSDDVCDIAYSEYGLDHKDGMSGCRHSWSWCKRQAEKYWKHFQYVGLENNEPAVQEGGIMKEVVKKRIEQHIKKGLLIARVYEDAGDKCCGCCGVLFLDAEHYKPNFCPECGCLLDWTKLD